MPAFQDKGLQQVVAGRLGPKSARNPPEVSFFSSSQSVHEAAAMRLTQNRALVAEQPLAAFSSDNNRGSRLDPGAEL